MAPSPTASLRWIYHEFGFHTLAHSSRDVYLLLLSRFFRMFAYGSGALVMAIYFNRLGFGDDKIGFFMTATLLGDVVISLILTLFADSLGRRRILLLGSTLMAMSGVVFALSENFILLLLAAIIGVISPSGNEIGPFRAIEESTIAHLTTTPETRSDIFAWHVMFGTLAVALGSSTTGFLVDWLRERGSSEIDSFRAVFWMYATMGLIKCGLVIMLSPACELEQQRYTKVAPETAFALKEDDEDSEDDETDHDTRLLQQYELSEATTKKAEQPSIPEPAPVKTGFAQLSQKSRIILLQLCLLFALDSYGSGLSTFAFISYFMESKFHVDPKILGSSLSTTWIVAAASIMFAPVISKRIGLIKTMVFTHLPASILLALIPVPSTYPLALALLVIRSSMSSMDQAPRSAFLSSVVLPEERTATMGIVNVVKTLSQSAGPLTTGLLAHSGLFWVAFVLAGSVKSFYDLGLLAFFLRTNLGEKSRSRQAEEEAGLQSAETSTK